MFCVSRNQIKIKISSVFFQKLLCSHGHHKYVRSSSRQKGQILAGCSGKFCSLAVRFFSVSFLFFPQSFFVYRSAIFFDVHPRINYLSTTIAIERTFFSVRSFVRSVEPNTLEERLRRLTLTSHCLKARMCFFCILTTFRRFTIFHSTNVIIFHLSALLRLSPAYFLHLSRTITSTRAYI